MLKILLAFVTLSSQPCDTCRISDDGLALIRNFEGYSPFVYKDSAGLDTIGFGHLIRPGEKFQQPLMGKEANKLLEKDVAHSLRAVNRLVGIPLRQHQFDALASFTFNIGEGALRSSTLLKKVNAKQHKDVPPQFMRWVYAGKKKIRGLEVRRQFEAEYYLGK